MRPVEQMLGEKTFYSDLFYELIKYSEVARREKFQKLKVAPQ